MMFLLLTVPPQDCAFESSVQDRLSVVAQVNECAERMARAACSRHAMQVVLMCPNEESVMILSHAVADWQSSLGLTCCTLAKLSW